MFRKYIIPLIALAGVAYAAFTVIWGERAPPTAAPISEAPTSPYAGAIAGSGMVEASTENISLGAPVAGIITRVLVGVGDSVNAGDPLCTIDDRPVRAELVTRQAAEAQSAAAQYDLTLAEALAAKSVTTVEDLDKKRFAVQKAGAQLALAGAELKATETDLARLTVRAPVQGQVLQLKAHPGEFAPVAATAAGQVPLILLGSVTPLHVRVDVDENDAWRVRGGAPAVAYLRGNRRIKASLVFVRFEPYVVPKKSLTGDSTERVDTRVLQVIFSFVRGDLPIYVGQQMDVFIATVDRMEAATVPSTPSQR